MINVRRSLIFSFAEKYCGVAVSIAATMYLSRVLTPRDIGIITVALAIVGLTHILRDFGVSNYIIQEKNLDDIRLGATFGVTLLTSWLMGGIIVLASGPASRLYDEPGIGSVMRVMSLNFLIIPFGSIVLTLLRRDGNFGALYWIKTLGRISYSATGVLLAWLGFSFMSMAWASVTGNIVTAVMAYVYMPSNLRLRPRFSGWSQIMEFGVLSVAANLVIELGARGSDLIIGRLVGIPQTGIYSKAQGLPAAFRENFMDAIWSVTISKFAASHRADAEMRTDFLQYTTYITAFAWPFFVYSGLMLFDIIRFLFGTQWDAAVPVGQILCVASFIGVLGSLNWVVVLAKGEMRTNLKIQAPVQFVNLALLAIGCLWGLVGAAYATVVGAVVGLVVSFHFTGPLIHVSLFDTARATVKSFLVSLLCAAPPLITVFAIGQRSPHIVFALVCSGIGTGFAWVIAIFLINHPIKDEVRRYFKHAIGVLRGLRPSLR